MCSWRFGFGGFQRTQTGPGVPLGAAAGYPCVRPPAPAPGDGSASLEARRGRNQQGLSSPRTVECWGFRVFVGGDLGEQRPPNDSIRGADAFCQESQ